MKIPQIDYTGSDCIPRHQDILDLFEKIKNRKDIFIDTSSLSREGRKLLFCAIGSGQKVVGVTAGAHSDEPIGIATTINFIKELTSSDRFAGLLSEYTFAIFPMLDPDGSAINEAWSRNLDYKTYFLHHYRNNQPAEDCEHGIPVSEAQTIRPEVAFFKKNIDRYKGRIEYYVTLHTTHVLGGSLFVVDRDFQNKKIISGLTNICKSHDLPIWDYRPKGDPTLTYIAPGFIGAPSVESYSEEYKNAPQILAMLKMSTYEYVLRKCGGKFGLISELPMFLVSEDFSSIEETNISISELKRRALELDREDYQYKTNDLKLIQSYQPNDENPWYKSALFTEKTAPERFDNEEKNLSRYEGLKAHKCDIMALEQLMPIENELKRHRLFIKCLDGISSASSLVQKHQNDFDQLFSKYERTFNLKAVSTIKQVEIQTEMILQGLVN